MPRFSDHRFGIIQKVGCFYFDESIRSNGGFILGAFIYSGMDLSPTVSHALTAAGLQPGKDEYKSRFVEADLPQRTTLRDHLHMVMGKVKVGIIIVPALQSQSLGDEALLGLAKMICANTLLNTSHEAFFDEGIGFGHSGIERFRKSFPAVVIREAQDSRLTGGIQVADLAAHYMGTMLLEEQSLISKRVKAREYSGYVPELELSLGFELWSRLRYSFFMSPQPKGYNRLPESIPEPWYNVEDYGLYVAPSCSPELRSAAVRRFGQVYLGCIH